VSSIKASSQVSKVVNKSIQNLQRHNLRVGIGFENKVMVSVWRTLMKENRRASLCCMFFRRRKEAPRNYNTVILS